MVSEFLNALKQGQALQEYQIVRVLGAGGFGLTYLAFDTNLDKAVAIKEYLPNDIALRSGIVEVLPKSTSAQEDFKWGLEQFLGEARTLAKFNHPNIIRINRFFEANGTGYIVMDYAEGQTLTDKIKAEGVIEENQLKPILLAISDGLKQAHSFGILHRDIKPGNIMLLDDGTPVLIDFGSARQAIGVMSKSVTSIVTPGYAPIEQYDTNGKQGPWTDIYALGAVAFVALVGERPPDATGRIRVDKMTPIAEQKKNDASKSFLAAIDWALCPQEECRPQDIDSWVAALSGESVAKVKKQATRNNKETLSGIDDEKTVINKQSSDRPARRQGANAPVIKPTVIKGRSKYWIAAIVIVAGGLISVPYLSNLFKQNGFLETEAVDTVVNDQSGSPTATPTDTIETTETTTETAIAIPNTINEEQLTDEAAWLRAVSINTIESYLNYLSSFPAGKFVADANIKLNDLSMHNNLSGQYFTSSVVNVRRWPSTASSVISSLSLGQQVSVSGKVVDREWYSLEQAGSGHGYVHSSLLQEFPVLNEASFSTQEREREEIRQRWQDAIEQRGR